jgi:hypothetical protein
MSTKNDLELRAIKTLRYLSADGVQTAIPDIPDYRWVQPRSHIRSGHAT